MKKSAAVFLVLSLLTGVPCFAEKVSETSPAELTATTLERLRQAYVQSDSEAFFRDVADEPAFSINHFRYQVATRLMGFSQVSLNFVTSENLVKKDKTNLKVHWERSMTSNRNGLKEQNQGNAELIFKIDHGRAKLFDIRGDDPF